MVFGEILVFVLFKKEFLLITLKQEIKFFPFKNVLKNQAKEFQQAMVAQIYVCIELNFKQDLTLYCPVISF